MHIPHSMLHGNICPITLTVSVAGVGSAAYLFSRSKDKISHERWAFVSALIFGLQMLNFQVTNGTSGHLLGGVLAVSLLGIPRAILSMSVILLIQSLFFGDGGLDAIGANVLNIGFIGAGLGGLLLFFLKSKGVRQDLSIFIASILSVILASLACTMEVSYSGVTQFSTMARAMLPVHLLIGVGEAILSVCLYYFASLFFNASAVKVPYTRIAVACVIVLLLAPYASSLPDGLEWAAHQLNINYTESPRIFAFLNDYSIAAIKNEHISTMAAGLIGIMLVWVSTISISKIRNVYD